MKFDHVRNWVFDLDNTLYPASCRLFDQIDVRMTAFIGGLFSIDAVQARAIQKKYFYEYGTTLRGLMIEHGIAPSEFLDYVHDIDHSPVPPNAALGSAIARLPGRRFIFTNGTVAHAEAVLNRIGITGHIDDIFDIAAADYLPKPEEKTYRRFLEHVRVQPGEAAMFEDIVRNLKVPFEMGMTTVLVRSAGNEDGGLINRLDGADGAEPHVHHTTEDLTRFLEAVLP